MTGDGFSARDDGVFEVSGRLTFQTVPEFLARTGDSLKNGTGKITIDMHGVTLADSAGLEWPEMACAAKRELVFTRIPAQVRDLIHVSGLQRVLVSREP